MTLFLSFDAFAGIYADLLFPALTMCDDFMSGGASIRVVNANYSVWEGGRHNRRAECVKPIASPAPGGPTEEVVASITVKSGNGEDDTSKKDDSNCNKCKKGGSIIEIDSRSLGEEVALAGVPFKLIYSSSRAEGYKLNGSLRVSVSDPSPAVTAINVGGTYAQDGVTFRSISASYSNVPGQVFEFTWDNKNSSGNLMPGSTDLSFAVIYTVHGKTIPVYYNTRIGGWKAKFLKIGGWQPDIYHQYDTKRKLLNRATGEYERITPTVRNSGTEYHIASDEGDEIYVFNTQGVHLKTLFGLTGATKYLFTHISGQLISITDAHGQVTTLTRDGTTNLVTSITSPKGQVTALSYNANQDLITITNPASLAHTMTYNGTGGLLETFTKPEGEVSTFTYDADGGLIEDAHSGGHTQTLSQAFTNVYYPMKRVTLETSLGRKIERDIQNMLETTGESHATQASLDGSFNSHRKGLKVETIELTGSHKFSMSYKNDPRIPNSRYLGRSSYGVGGKMHTEIYDRSASLSNPSDPFSIISMTNKTTSGTDISYDYYNGPTREWTNTSAGGKVSKKKLDTLERVVESQVGNLEKTYYSYFTDGRISQIKQGDRVTRFSYDSNGYLSKMIDPIGRIQTYQNDSLGRVLSSTTYDGRKTSFFYDDNSRLIGLRTPNKRDHEFIYNAHELLGAYLSPQVGSEENETSYEYNLDKQLTKTTLPDSREIVLSYYANDMRLEKIEADGSDIWYDYEYNKAGPRSIHKVTPSKDHWLRYTYNGVNLASESYERDTETPLSRVAYEYDSKFRLEKLRLSDKSGKQQVPIIYSYDKDDKMIVAGELAIERDHSLGFISKLKLKNAEVYYSVDPRYGELSKIEYRFKNIPSFFREFKRDKLGRIVEELTPNGAYTFLYDKGGRFLGRSAKGTGAPVSNFIYDTNGNRVRGNDNGKSFKAEFDVQDRLIKFNNTTITYNANGQVSSKINPGIGTTVYSYDSFGNLLEVQTPTNVVKYEIDGRNRRTEVRQFSSIFKTRYVWDGQLRVIAELNSIGALVKRYVYAEGVNSPEYMIHEGKKYLFVKDHRGSVNLVVNAETGEIKQKLSYSEWGEIVEDTNPEFQPFGFAGGLYDNVTKLYRFGARDYDPEIGRWLSKDPIRFKGGDTNLYGYTFQDPVNLKDPSGLDITIHYYGGGTGHIGISVGGETAQGYYGGYQNSGGTLGALVGRDGEGTMATESETPTESKTIRTTAEQDQKVQEYLDKMGRKKNRYNLYDRNCATVAGEALRAGGISAPTGISGNVPALFIEAIGK